MEKGGAESYICVTLYIVINVGTKKNSKKRRASILSASAVKWAEIAADPEMAKIQKKKFSPAHGHHVAS